MTVGIVSYGSYIPRLRIARTEYQKAWGSCGADIKEKAVPEFDEDTLTMGIEAAKECLRNSPTVSIGALAIASTSFPYEEKVMSGTVAAMLDLPERLFSTEHGQSMRAGSEAFITAAQLLGNGNGGQALVIVSDAPRALPKDTIEHGLGAGAAAFVLGTEDIIAEIEYVNSFVSENMGERYRIDGNSFLNDIGVKGFTGIAFNELVTKAIKDVMQHMNRTAADYDFLVVQETDGKRVKSLAKKLGFSEEKVNPGLLYAQTGDTGAASTMLSLAAVLDEAKNGDKILLVSYGSGSGSQAVSFQVIGNPVGNQRLSVRKKLENKKYIDYVQYLKLKRQIM